MWKPFAEQQVSGCFHHVGNHSQELWALLSYHPKHWLLFPVSAAITKCGARQPISKFKIFLHNPHRSDQWELTFWCVSMCSISQDKGALHDRPKKKKKKMSAFSPMLFSQSILCWQVWRKMSNKPNKRTSECVPVPPHPPPLHALSVYKFMHSSSAAPTWNSLVFTFKLVLSVNSTETSQMSSQTSAEDFSGFA